MKLKGSFPRPGAAAPPGTNPPKAETPAGGLLAHIESCTLDLAGLATAAWSGDVHYDLSGGVNRLEVKKAAFSIPDLAAASDYVGPPNVKNREPWFGDIKLAGAVNYDGSMLWERGALAALDGTIKLNAVDLRLGATDPFVATGLTGGVPLLWRGPQQPQRAGGPHGKMILGGATFSRLGAGRQELEIENPPGGVVVRTPIKFTAPGLELAVSDFEVGNTWVCNAPVIAFRMDLRVDADALLKAQNVIFPGLHGCVLAGEPFECAIRRTEGLRGPWELVAGRTREYRGGPLLSGNFYGGKLVLADLNARGVFSPVTVTGASLMAVGKGWPEHNEGFNIQGILTHFPQYGQFNTRLSLFVRNIETTALDLHAVQRASLEIQSAPSKGEEYWYDGNFAAAFDPKMLRSSFPSFFSNEYIRTLTFGVRQVGLRFDLENGAIAGPKPLLKGGYLLRGYGAESNPFATRFKKDIEGDFEVELTWEELLRTARDKLQAHAGGPLPRLTLPEGTRP